LLLIEEKAKCSWALFDLESFLSHQLSMRGLRNPLKVAPILRESARLPEREKRIVLGIAREFGERRQAVAFATIPCTTWEPRQRG
jgi:hypothetical protein